MMEGIQTQARTPVGRCRRVLEPSASSQATRGAVTQSTHVFEPSASTEATRGAVTQSTHAKAAETVHRR